MRDRHDHREDLAGGRGGGGMRSPVEVGELRELAGRVAPVVLAGDQLLPVGAAVAALLPGGGLRRGSVVGVSARGSAVGSPARGSEAGQVGTGIGVGGVGAGATSLLLTLVAAASAAGSWVAFVGLPDVGWVAAAEAGLDLSRVAVVPDPGGSWAMVTAALIDAVDVVVARPPPRVRVRLSEARRLAARARERSAVLVVTPADCWPEVPDVRLTATSTRWTGLGRGHGALRERTIEVVRDGRGAAAHERRGQVAV